MYTLYGSKESGSAAIEMALERCKTPYKMVRASSWEPDSALAELERIKEAIREVFAREPELRVAIRDGRQQSQSDWESLYDDLVRLGALKPDERD